MNTLFVKQELRKSFPAVLVLAAWLIEPGNSSILGQEGPGKRATAAVRKQKELTSAALDLKGKPADPFSEPGKATVLVFLSTDCPIANRYAPEIQRLAKEFGSRGMKFWLVYPDADTSPSAILRHTKEYRFTLRALRDPWHVLVGRAQVRVTPEVAVFHHDGRLLYHGRIDDRFVDFGKERASPTQHDLREAMEAVLADKPVSRASTRAVGCYISQ